MSAIVTLDLSRCRLCSYKTSGWVNKKVRMHVAKAHPEADPKASFEDCRQAIQAEVRAALFAAFPNIDPAHCSELRGCLRDPSAAPAPSPSRFSLLPPSTHPVREFQGEGGRGGGRSVCCGGAEAVPAPPLRPLLPRRRPPVHAPAHQRQPPPRRRRQVPPAPSEFRPQHPFWSRFSYSCSECGFTCKELSSQAARRHVNSAHGVPGVVGENIKDHRPDISALIEEQLPICFPG